MSKIEVKVKSSQEEFIKSRIRSKLEVNDPEVYEKLVDIIYRFAIVLMYSNDDLKRIVVDVLFSVVPEDIALDLVKRYIQSVKAKYDAIKSLISTSGLIDSFRGGRGLEDMMISAMIELYKQQMMAGGAAGTVPSGNSNTGSINYKVKEIPEELKKALENL